MAIITAHRETQTNTRPDGRGRDNTRNNTQFGTLEENGNFSLVIVVRRGTKNQHRIRRLGDDPKVNELVDCSKVTGIHKKTPREIKALMALVERGRSPEPDLADLKTVPIPPAPVVPEISSDILGRVTYGDGANN